MARGQYVSLIGRITGPQMLYCVGWLSTIGWCRPTCGKRGTGHAHPTLPHRIHTDLMTARLKNALATDLPQNRLTS
jgi:hypothetical protein